MSKEQTLKQEAQDRIDGLDVLVANVRREEPAHLPHNNPYEEAIATANSLRERIVAMIGQSEGVTEEAMQRIDGEISALRARIATIPFLVEADQADARERVQEYLVGDFLWYNGRPCIVTGISAEKAARLQVQFYNGQKTNIQFFSGRGRNAVQRYDSSNAEEQQRWSEARDADVEISEWITALLGSEQAIRQWVAGAAGDPESQNVLRKREAEIHQLAPSCDAVQLLQDAAVKYLGTSRAIPAMHNILMIKGAGNPQREQAFSDARRRAYNALLREASSIVLNDLRSDRRA